MSDPVPVEPVPIDEQIACVERELGFRQRLYPRWVKSLKLTQAAADEELARMSAVLKTLQRIRMGQDHHVPNADEIRRGAEARVLCMAAPYMHSSKLVALQRKLEAGS